MQRDFARSYGPWAVVAGASEGTGRALADEIAARGLNLVLVARRKGPLDTLAAELSECHGVECLTVSADLSEADATARIVEAVGDRDVGLYVSNAGSDPYGAHFVDQSAANWRALVTRNVLTTMECCHHFGAAMTKRGHGGLLLIGSGACYGGAAHIAAYAGSKAFELAFSEGLWVELKSQGVDVLYYILGQTDTPAFRQLLADKNVTVPSQLANPIDVARLALDQLGDGPIQNYGSGDGERGFAPQTPAERRERAKMITRVTAPMFGA